ncbi:ComEC/Rec2 family competence protein [uncultured Enterovirga sp.]|uniref:ComEC/Rec2 family competence protein n=1 Tax=uncultured Enterovirga sp. TaxID=2026352 RepID=UPI0035CB7D71
MARTRSAAGAAAAGTAPAIRAGGWNAAVRNALAALPAQLSDLVQQEIDRRRLFPWIAVAYGLGIVLAFAADGAVSVWPPLAAGAGFACGAYLARHRFGRMIVFVALTAVFFGSAAALVRTEMVAAPVLDRLHVGRLEGFIETVEERASGGGRLVIRTAKLERREGGQVPSSVRVTVRAVAGLAPGDYVGGTVRLLPPPEAARPGGYDFARDAYFRGIGAVGSASGRLVRIEPPPFAPDLSLRSAALIDRARNALTARIVEAIGGQAGAVSAALVTGKRGLIDERTNDILRAAGIYHVVSISGLHMVLAAGLFFAATRALLALSPALALGWPIKKIAAIVGMAGATAYCIFSGSEVATERSLVMILVMQGAILFDRPALSLRNLAISAILVLTREPEALLGPSFQMSYAAVAGLIAFAEAARRVRPAAEAGDPLRRAALWVGMTLAGILGTTLVATLATGPFGTFHFQNVQPYGLIGNAATLPLVSFAVMPAAVIGVVALPFGLDRPIWAAMGYATDGVLRLSEWVAGFAGSTLVVPAFGAGALSLLAFALLVATLCGSALRLLAGLPFILGVALASAAPRPDIYVARDGSGAAVRGRDGRLALLGRVPAFTAEQWLKADGDARRAADASLKAGPRCDRIGCTIEMRDGRIVSHLLDRRGFAEDCGRAAVVLSHLQAPPDCAAPTLVDRAFLAGHGATTLFATSSGFRLETTRRPGESRPWLARKASARPAAAIASASPPPGRPASRPAPAEEAVPDLPDADAEP